MIKTTLDFELSALKDYNPPKYPTYLDAKADPALLKKIPSRWKKNMAALACVGLLGGVTVLSGCFFPSGGGGHFGGSGGPPAYIVYLTEQEVIDVIKNKAEYMGLEMKDTPPNIFVTVGWDNTKVGLHLFNEENNVAFSHVGNEWVASEAQEAFDAKNDDLTVKIFHSGVSEIWGSATDEIKTQKTEELKQHLTAQVREFIEWLQAEGIIQ